jgi:16S rRNA processing protein RimM
MDKTISIGFTKKPHGLKGEIKLHIEEKYLEDMLNTDIVLLDIKGKKTPFFVEDVRVGNNIIAKFEDINTPEGAISIASKEIFLRESDIIPDNEREMEVDVMPYEHCVGYTILNDGVEIGVINQIEEYPQQEMAILNYQNRDILIPLNKQFIIKLDNKKKVIEMELPDGLLEL